VFALFSVSPARIVSPGRGQWVISSVPAAVRDEFESVCLAGRIMSIRDMGKASFAVIQDGSGKIQLYIKRDEICPDEDKTLYDKVWKHLTDIGDIIGVKGYVFTTKTGETSIHVHELTFLAKALRPLPVVKEKEGETFDAVTDPDYPPGCLAVQGALSCGDAAESIKQELMLRRAKGEEDLRKRFERAIAEGDLPTGSDAADLARYISAILQGMAVQAAGGTNREQLRKIADVTLRTWPPPAGATPDRPA